MSFVSVLGGLCVKGFFYHKEHKVEDTENSKKPKLRHYFLNLMLDILFYLCYICFVTRNESSR